MSATLTYTEESCKEEGGHVVLHELFWLRQNIRHHEDTVQKVVESVTQLKIRVIDMRRHRVHLDV